MLPDIIIHDYGLFDNITIFTLILFEVYLLLSKSSDILSRQILTLYISLLLILYVITNLTGAGGIRVGYTIRVIVLSTALVAAITEMLYQSFQGNINLLKVTTDRSTDLTRTADRIVQMMYNIILITIMLFLLFGWLYFKGNHALMQT